MSDFPGSELGDVAEPSDPLIVLGVDAHVVTGFEDAAVLKADIEAYFRALGELSSCHVTLDVLSIAPDSLAVDVDRAQERVEVDPRLTRRMVGVMNQFVERDLPRRDAVITWASTILTREGIHSVRDTLAVGKKQIRAARNAGDSTVKTIGAALNELGFGRVWHESPSLTNLVGWYPDVLDIPGLAVDNSLTGMTLREVLSAPLAKLAEHYGSTSPDFDRAKQARVTARSFVVRYLAEAERLDEGNSGTF